MLPHNFITWLLVKGSQISIQSLHCDIVGSPEANGTALMKKINVSDGDVVGIAVQQNDLPMVQFTVNGEPRHDLAVNRFRGTVFPSIYLPENEGLAVRLVFDEASFKQLAPNVRFGPVIVARGLL